MRIYLERVAKARSYLVSQYVQAREKAPVATNIKESTFSSTLCTRLHSLESPRTLYSLRSHYSIYIIFIWEEVKARVIGDPRQKEKGKSDVELTRERRYSSIIEQPHVLVLATENRGLKAIISITKTITVYYNEREQEEVQLVMKVVHSVKRSQCRGLSQLYPGKTKAFVTRRTSRGFDLRISTPLIKLGQYIG